MVVAGGVGGEGVETVVGAAVVVVVVVVVVNAVVVKVTPYKNNLFFNRTKLKS